MASEEHLEILREGVDAWNRWRGENPEIISDLRGADLRSANLSGVDLSEADLSGADLRSATLQGANLSYADLRGADLFEVDLGGAKLSRGKLNRAMIAASNLCLSDLSGARLSNVDLRNSHLVDADLRRASLLDAKLSGAKLPGADLRGAHLSGTDFSWADLSGTDLREANLNEAIFSRADLNKADLSGAIVNQTVFAGIDLSTVNGLEAVTHKGPSTIGGDTLSRSKGLIPEEFLRGCGLGEWEVEAAKLHRHNLTNKELGDLLYRVHDLRAQQPVQVSALFISYSHADGAFVDHLERYLTHAGIRFWRDVHHATAGRLERQVDRAIRLNPTVLLILSESAVESDWVEHEVRLARRIEKEAKRDVLCPVALDESWKACRWPERLLEQIKEYNILDFSNWREGNSFARMYRRLIEGLDLFYRQDGGET